MRKTIGSGLLFAFGFLVWAQASPENQKAAFADMDESLARLSKITGLKQVRKVQYDTIDKPRLKAFLEEQIKEQIKPDEIRAEEQALKKLGLVPQNFDLARNTVDLMTEQAAAFYDYRKKKLFLMDAAAASAGDQETVLAHELAHALADQHFNLNKYLHHGKTDDSSLARMAVMEGQATWLMYEVQAQKTGQSLTTSPAIVDAMSKESDSASGQFPVLDKSPLYMRESLLFPYLQGLKFQQAVILKQGKAGFSEVFRNPPANSQEILHPAKYLNRVAVKAPAMPSIAARPAYRVLTGGSIGEFDHSVLIEQYTGKPEAAALAPHWKAGGFELLEEKKKRYTVLLYASEWDTPASAQQMFDAYRRVLQGKWKTLHAKKESAGLLVGEGDDGYFRLELDGTRLTSIEGMKSWSDVAGSRTETAKAKVN
jgi:hypothetical protein